MTTHKTDAKGKLPVVHTPVPAPSAPDVETSEQHAYTDTSEADHLTASTVLHLQRSIGNRATTQLASHGMLVQLDRNRGRRRKKGGGTNTGSGTGTGTGTQSTAPPTTAPPQAKAPVVPPPPPLITGLTMEDIKALKLPDGITTEGVVAIAHPDLGLSVEAVKTFAGITGRDNAYILELAKGMKPALPHGRNHHTLKFFASDTYGLTAADAIKLTREVPVTYNGADAVRAILGELTGVTSGDALLGVFKAVSPLPGLEAQALIKLMKNDGASAAQVAFTFDKLAGAGKTGANLRQTISDLRGGLDPDAKDVTAVGGSRVQSGKDIAAQAEAAFVKDGPGLAALGKYPTGHDPNARTEEELWEDVRLGIALKLIDKPTETDTPAQRSIRQKLALNRLMKLGGGVQPKIVQQLFQFNEGAYPRDPEGASAEDGYGASYHAHTTDRHVLNGSGTIADLTDLVLRALGHHGPPCPGKAGAYPNDGASTTGMKNAMIALVGANPGANGAPSAKWKSIRADLIRGGTINDDVAASVSGNMMAAQWDAFPYNKVGNRMNQKGMPSNGTLAQYGGRPYYVGHAASRQQIDNMAYKFRGGWYVKPPGNGAMLWEPNVGLAKNDAAPTQVHVRIIGADVKGGWFIHSSWPVS